MNKTLLFTLNECKTYKDDIIPRIISLLESNGYNAHADKNHNEILVDADNLSKINNLIQKELDIPEDIKDIIIDTHRTKDGIYIRLKFK